MFGRCTGARWLQWRLAGNQVNAGISVSDDGVKGFYLAIGQAIMYRKRSDRGARAKDT